MDSISQTSAQAADYSQGCWNNNGYVATTAAETDSAGSWGEWKARKSHGSVVYVNPEFVKSPEKEAYDESPRLQSPESPVPDEGELLSAKRGPRTPPEVEEKMQEFAEHQVYLDDESDCGNENDVIVDGIVAEEEDEDTREAGELEDEGEVVEDEAEKSTEEITSNQLKVTIGPQQSRSVEKVSTEKEISPSVSPRCEKKRKARSRSRSPRHKRHRSRSHGKKERKSRRRTRSSSRDTFDGIRWMLKRTKNSTVCSFSEPPTENIRCNQCNRLFASAHDASVHEIRSHDTRIPCAVCTKVLTSPAKLVNHIEKHHPADKVRCRFCEEKFGGRAETLSHGEWNDFREHIFREILRRKIKDYNNRCPDTTALRGVGRCPHGPPIKCRNFPKCPGARCIYSHGRCDFADSCSNADCPFDHPNRPRVCMACVKDLKSRRRTRSPPSRGRD